MRTTTLMCTALLAVTACTQSAPERGTLPDVTVGSTTGAVPTTVSPASTSAPGGVGTSVLPGVSLDLPGKLAIVDGSGEVVVSAADGGDRLGVTSNAISALHRQPVWSPDGSRLVYAEDSSEGSFVVFAEGDAELRRVPVLDPPFYFHWDDSSSHVGVLRGDDVTTIALEIVSAQGSGGPIVVGGGAPLFFDWSPGEDLLAVHEALQPLRVTSRAGEPVALTVDNGPYSVPAWTSFGITHVAEVAGGFELRTATPGGPTTTLAEVESLTSVVPDPTGRRLAAHVLASPATSIGLLAQATEVPRIAGGMLVVLDVESSTLVEIPTDQTVAFFWSPNGMALLVLDVSIAVGPVWKVWNAESGDVSVYPAVPLGSGFIREVLPFFEQYALSIQLWAPDSSAFAYPGQLDTGGGIFVQSLDREAPVLVSDGTWVTWSPA